ncbi:conserved Plasmodium protein, unknown function, partial [Plasmodium ovale curtisi]
MHLDTNDSGERKDETYLNTFAKKNEKKRKRNENDESGNLSESNNHAENYEEDIAQINNDFVVNGLEIYDNNLLPDMDYNKQNEFEKEINDQISHNKKNTKLMKISTDLNNDPSDIQNELDMLDSSKNSSVSFFSKKTRTNKKRNDKNLSQRKEASNSSGNNNSDDSDWLENIIKDKEKGSAKKSANKNFNKTPRRASNKNDTQELYDEGLENSVFNISVLEDVDIKSFYGTTGKIIKLRIRNFLNHENLELSFNCYKNITSDEDMDIFINNDMLDSKNDNYKVKNTSQDNNIIGITNVKNRQYAYIEQISKTEDHNINEKYSDSKHSIDGYANSSYEHYNKNNLEANKKRNLVIYSEIYKNNEKFGKSFENISKEDSNLVQKINNESYQSLYNYKNIKHRKVVNSEEDIENNLEKEIKRTLEELFKAFPGQFFLNDFYEEPHQKTAIQSENIIIKKNEQDNQIIHKNCESVEIIPTIENLSIGHNVQNEMNTESQICVKFIEMDNQHIISKTKIKDK